MTSGVESLESRQLLTADVLLSDSFEAGQWAGNWVEDSQNDWFTSSQRSTNGNYSAEIDGWASNATLTLSAPIDLSGYGAAELTFDWLIESGFDGGEYLALDLSADGGASWQTDVRRLNGNVDAENTWHSETVDLSTYTTSQLLVRFRSKVSRSNEDANVDNVKITAVPATPAFPPSIDYADFSDVSDLNLMGYATSTLDRLRLTPAEASRRGAAWHHDKQFVSVGFETTFQFQMTELNEGGGADGFAFVIQNTSDSALGPGGGHNGFHQIANSVAVEFDSTHGSDESSDSHVSVHTRGTERNSSLQEFSLGSFDTSGFKLNDGNVHTAKIAYTPGTMTVFVDDLNSPALTIPLDLKSLLNLDLGRAYIGFTGATGGGWQNHDILNWSFANTVDTTTTIGIEDSAAVEGNTGQSSLDFVVKRFGDLSGSDTVDWVTSAGSATTGVDYAASSGQVTFAPGEAEKIVSVAVFGDTAEEEHETFQVDLQLSQGSGSIVDGSATGTIQNDETSLAIGDATATEGSTEFQFIETYIESSATGLNATRTLHLSPDGFLYAGASVPASVRQYHYDTGEFVGLVADDINLESATYRGFVFGPDGDIYVSDQLHERVLRFDGATGQPNGEFVISGLGGLNTPKDLAFGPDQNLYVASADSGEVLQYQGPFAAQPGAFMGVVASAANGGLGSPAALTFGPNGNLYIADRSTDSVLRVDDVTGVVDTFVQPGTGGYDASFAGGLQFGPDRTGDGNMDLYASSYNTDSLLIFDGVDGSLADVLLPTGLGGLYRPTGFVVEPDGNLLVASIGGPDKVLRFGEESKAVFTVTLSKPSAVPVSVDYTTRDQSADADDGDYNTQGGTLVFPPGVTSRTISIQTNDDGSYEPDETFELVLSNPVAAAITDGTGVATIFNDDVAPPNEVPVADDHAWSVTEDGILNVAEAGVLSGDTDADNDPLTASLVSQPSNGVVVLDVDGSFTYTPSANFNGSDSFTYTAFDGIDHSNIATVSLTVNPVNDAPVAYGQAVSTKENTPHAITLSGSDVEDDELSFTVLAGPNSGSLSGTAPNLVYTPDLGFSGADSFTFVANDGAADSAAAVVSIDVTDNIAPIADSQAVAVDEDSSVAILLTASDLDSDPITFQLVDSPLHGSLTGTAPNLVYTPAANFNGADSFTFFVNDGTDDSVPATVTLTVNPLNDAPSADAQAVTTAEDTPLAITLNGDDVDGDSLSYIIVDGPANGTLIGSGATHTFTPTANFSGSDSLTFKVNDGLADSPVVTVSIDVTAVNDAPVASADSYSLDQDTTLSVVAPGVLGNDGDVDGDSITASLVTSASNGSLTLGSDGAFDYTPDPGFVGSDSFSYRADDGSVVSNTVTVTLTVNALSVGPNLSHGEVTSVGDSWQTIILPTTYTSMVVIATPRYNAGSGPGVVRINNASGNSFDVRIDNVGSSAFSGGVHFVVVEEGVYDEAGFKLEAVKYDEAQTSRKNGWGIDTVGYQQSYNSPVVVGQVMTANDEDWSVFWASSGSRTSPPTSSALNVGKHVAEDPDTTRATETVGYLVIEATQEGTIEGLPFVAGVGSDIVRGVGNGSYTYNYTAMPNAKTAVLSSAGMDGGDGGWAVLNGSNPLSSSGGTIDLVIDEDQLRDSERNHTTEQVAYFVIDPPSAVSAETATNLPTALPTAKPLSVSLYQAPRHAGVVSIFNMRDETPLSRVVPHADPEPLTELSASMLDDSASGRTSVSPASRLQAIDAVFSLNADRTDRLDDELLELLSEIESIEGWLL